MENKLFDSMSLGNFHQRFFAFCRAVGVNRVNLEYSGGGDSGGVDHIEVIPKNIGKDVANYIRELEEDLCSPIYNRHGNFADGGGYSVNGVVVYDADSNRAWIEGTDHYYEFDEEGEEESCNDESWDEMVYDSEDNTSWEYDRDGSEERDFTFVIAYAKLTKKSLPTNIHNLIASDAIAGNDTAKEYMASWSEKN